MAADARAISTYEAIHPDWEMVREWAKATFTRERMAEIGLCAATVSLVGVVAFSVHKAMEHYIILGF